MKLTPNDIRNPKLASGYSGVRRIGGQPSRSGQKVYFQAEKRLRSGNGRGAKWCGPGRATALEAAQDYCDYRNGLPSTPSVALKTAGHKVRRKPGRKVPPEVAAAYGVIRDFRARVKAESKNYVYLIAERGGEFVKIGESAKPPARPAELQTGNARTLILLAYYEVSVLRDADKAVHQQFVDDHEQNEWFRPTVAVLSHFGITSDEFLRRCGGTTQEVQTAA